MMLAEQVVIVANERFHSLHKGTVKIYAKIYFQFQQNIICGGRATSLLLTKKQERMWTYSQFCVNAKASKKIKVIRGGEQGNIFAALTAAKTEILLTIRKFLLFE